MSIDNKIKDLRGNVGMLQRELAAKLCIGEGFLSKIENNQKLPKRGDLKIISKLFQTDISELETLWLANKIYEIIKEEDQAMAALKVAEQKIKYRNNQR